MAYNITVTLTKTRVGALFAQEMPVGSSVREAHEKMLALRQKHPGFLRQTQTYSGGRETCIILLEWQSKETQQAFREEQEAAVTEYEKMMSAFNKHQGNTVAFASRVV